MGGPLFESLVPLTIAQLARHDMRPTRSAQRLMVPSGDRPPSHFERLFMPSSDAGVSCGTSSIGAIASAKSFSSVMLKLASWARPP